MAIAIAVVLIVFAGAAVLYLAVTTPRVAVLLRPPLAEADRALLAWVPDDADAYALIPTAAAVHRTLLDNAILHKSVAEWSAENELPAPWMLGDATVVAWRRDDRTSYAIRLDRVRAFVVRAWSAATSNAIMRWEGTTLIVNDPLSPRPRPTRVGEELALADGLPEGSALVVQRGGEGGAFPPIGRPAVTSVRVTPAAIDIVSHAPAGGDRPAGEIQPRFARGAMLAAAFAEPPRVFGDLKRLLATDVATLASGGGSVALYEVETGTFLPRPRGVIAVPSTDEVREALRRVEPVIALVGETRESGEQLLVSFDRTSLGRYLEDEMIAGEWPVNRWALRIDPARLVPVLRRLGDNVALRLAAPRVYRGARDLRRWIGALDHAASVEAADSVRGDVEELRVRIVSK